MNSITERHMLIERLEDAIDNRRFDRDFPKGVDTGDIQWMVSVMLPVVESYGCEMAARTSHSIINADARIPGGDMWNAKVTK